MQLRSLRHFLGLCLGLEFGQNQAKTVDKKAIFSTRERVRKPFLVQTRFFLRTTKLVRAEALPSHGRTACAHAAAKKPV